MAQIFHKQRNNLFLLKETTPGTWMTGTSVYVAANARVPVRNLKFKVQNKEIERYIDRNSLDSLESLFYGETGEITFETDLYTLGTIGATQTNPDVGMDLLWKLAFNGATFVANTSLTYAENTSSQVRASAGVEFISEDGTASFRCGIKGASAKVKLDLQVGAQSVLTWTLTGPIAYESTVPQIGIAGTPVASIVRDTMLGRVPQFKGVAFNVGGVARQISKLSLDWGISTEMNTDSLDPTTYERTILTERKPTVTIDPQTTPKATQDDFGLFFAGTSAALSIVMGSGAGKVCTITIPNVQRKTADFGERGVITTTETTFRVNGNSDAGEDAITVAFT